MEMVSAVKKLYWLVGFTLPLLLFGCGRAVQIQPAANDSSNQVVEKKEPIEKFESDENLQAQADALLPLFDDMPPVPVYVNDEPIIKSGTNTEKSVAYTLCDRHKFPSIFVKKVFYQKTNQKRIANALKHELTHAWLCRKGMPWGHDAEFRKKFKQVGGFGN